MSKKIAFLKKFVEDHKVGLAVGMTALAFVLLMMKQTKEMNKFLEEHGLLEEFYALED